ncbi:NCS2 family permease [Francisella philomiragia]|uniref:Xanthine/uracil permease family/inorganic anion transporter, sulfate permease (SulP) family protein n=1 Tax=Francisella philomiragia subsp. philomiragia (strain ATCC 25017 / CCUG 19701 / FSC 153 / O\|nr:NCS2 family permease [Francisella philomiragia]AJI46814.1 permease family protein [Francisella philomiragia]AJI48529.1 permease family protein [Francisella philomiragia]MBK2021323.1 NCS2 family permease [Francisella philomiragia]MBK2030506.1 NCS2 family permease [Francisella philomiragia]MBK2263641.1 NCS2 family permease [Francisella philomiragia]
MLKTIESFFDLKANNTSIKKEFLAALASFLAISYIIVVNPKILAAAGMPSNALVTSTILVSAFGSIIMGLFTRNPFVVAPGMGMNIFFSYTAVSVYHLPWQTVLGATFWSGIIFSLLVILNIRTKIMLSLPKSIKQSLGAGIGLFIAYIGFINSGFITSNEGLLTLNSINPHTILFMACLILLVILFIKKIPAPIIIVIIIGYIFSIPLEHFSHEKIIALPTTIVSAPDFSLIGQIDFISGLKFAILPTIFTFCFLSLFDGTGTISSLYGSMQKEHNHRDKELKKTFLADATSATVSGILGSSPSTVVVESGVGIAQGARSGLTAIFAGLMFLPFTIIMMTLASSISTGIATGILVWFLISVFCNRKELNITAGIITIFCAIMFLHAVNLF